MAAFQRVDSIKPIHYENSVSFNETATTVTYQPETVTYLPEEDSQPDTPQESLVLLPTASSHPAVPEVTEEAVAQDTAQSGTAILLGAPYPLASYDTTGQPLEGGTSSAGGSEPGTEMPDTTAPIIEIISPANNSYTKATPIVAQYTVDGAGMTKNVDLAEGANTITITETDASGNAGSASVNVTLDTIAPLIEITYPADGSVLTSTPVTVIYTVDGVEKTKDAAL
ncbi:MAG: hypothetical protein Q8R14_02475, partial [Candidatus Omnitrophota bacterium]|nr:hypothetical protein [Candidatus Omnitrophota bacterium]